VCDDDPSIRHVVSGLLAAHGFEVVAEVELATDAVRVVELTKPEVIVLDVALMGMTGLEAIPAIRQSVPNAVVIVFSAFDNVRQEAIEAGADHVIDKTHASVLDDVIAGLASG
jgi:CheY-like chemotaxis protein